MKNQEGRNRNFVIVQLEDGGKRVGAWKAATRKTNDTEQKICIPLEGIPHRDIATTALITKNIAVLLEGVHDHHRPNLRAKEN